MSTAGGLHTAFERGDALECTAIQIFTSSPRQWKGRAMSEVEVEKFKKAWKKSTCEACFAHDKYLTRLGTRDKTILGRSRTAFSEELRAGQRLGLSYLVFHPVGDDDADEDAVLCRVAESLNEIFEQVPGEGTMVLLETTAGQGANVGYNFAQLQRIIDEVADDERLGICLDTCHVFAAGYDIRTATGYGAMIDELDDVIGLHRLKVLHLNDSRKPCGSRVDRHAHIGQGEIGELAFGLVMRDPRLESIPKVIETPKEDEMDPVNLGVLRRLAEAE